MRILAAILFTDIEGFTALMEKDEESCLRSLERQKRIIDNLLPQYEGRLLKFMGDGSLSMFPSAVQAANCAVALQRAFREAPTIPVRIGIHQGDVLLEDGDIVGDAVNTASRIQSAGIAGSVLISGKVNDELRNHKDLSTKLMGSFHLKNITDPVPVYAIVAEGLSVPGSLYLPSAEAPYRAAKSPEWPIRFEKFKIKPITILILTALLIIAWVFFKSILQKNSLSSHSKDIGVLSFRNLSNLPEDEYLAEGLTDEMISLLCTSRDLRIKKIPQEAILYHNGVDMLNLFREIQIGSVLEGKIQRKGNRLWVFAQLRNPYTNDIIWAQTYENKDLKDLMDVREEIALLIVSAVKSNLSVDEKLRFEYRPTQNPEAYALYLQGRYDQNKRTRLSMQAAIQLFNQALKLDSNYTLAWSGLSDNYSLLIDNGFLPYDSGIGPARKALNRALSLDSTLAEVHSSKAIFLSSLEGQHREAIFELEKALAIKPHYAAAHQWYALELTVAGRFKESLLQINQALELEPLSERIAQLKGLILKLSRNYVQALRWQDSLIQLFPENIDYYRQKSECFYRLGQKDSALRYARFIPEPPPYDAEFWTDVITANKNRLNKRFNDLQKTQSLEREDKSIYFVYLQQNDSALNQLEAAFAKREFSWLKFLGVSPTWDPLRNEPRFARLVRSLNQ